MQSKYHLQQKLKFSNFKLDMFWIDKCSLKTRLHDSDLERKAKSKK